MKKIVKRRRGSVRSIRDSFCRKREKSKRERVMLLETLTVVRNARELEWNGWNRGMLGARMKSRKLTKRK